MSVESHPLLLPFTAPDHSSFLSFCCHLTRRALESRPLLPNPHKGEASGYLIKQPTAPIQPYPPMSFFGRILLPLMTETWLSSSLVGSLQQLPLPPKNLWLSGWLHHPIGTKTLVKVDHLPKVKREIKPGSRWVQGSSSISRWIIKKGATKFQHQPRNEETHDPWRAAYGKRSVGWIPHKKSSKHVHISTNCFSIRQVHFPTGTLQL